MKPTTLQETLKATSNVIELKEGKKYLLVFSGDNIKIESLQRIRDMLKENGVDGLCIAIRDNHKLEVIETS